MVEDIKLDTFPKESGAYLFKVDDEVIYVGSSINLYMRMTKHRCCIRKGSEHGYKQDLYQYLQSNHFAVEFQLINDYRQLEQELIEQYHPKYNANRAYTGVAWNGNKAEYGREHYNKFKEEALKRTRQYYKANKEEVLKRTRQYYVSHKQQKKQYYNKYDNQLCLYNCETITLCALKTRFMRMGIEHPTLEAKKYLIGANDDQ